jgi:cytochrome b561
MMTPNVSEIAKAERYTNVAIALHWLIALFILFNLSVGYFMDDMAKPLKMTIMPIHVSAGISVLVLTALRVIWRLTHRPPAFPANMPKRESVAAHTVQGLLYLLMVAMPITGWMLLSAHPPRPGPGFDIWWGLFHLKPIESITALAAAPGGVAAQEAFHDKFVGLHGLGGWMMIGLLLFHVGGALKHQFVDKHAEFARMGIGQSRKVG